jgi:hypothetical protein
MRFITAEAAAATMKAARRAAFREAAVRRGQRSWWAVMSGLSQTLSRPVPLRQGERKRRYRRTLSLDLTTRFRISSSGRPGDKWGGFSIARIRAVTHETGVWTTFEFAGVPKAVVSH